jgi:hypothetical protein
MESPSDHLILRCPDRGTKAHSRNPERIVVATERQDSPAAANTDDEPCLGEHDANRTCLSLRRGRKAHHREQAHHGPTHECANGSVSALLHVDLPLVFSERKQSRSHLGIRAPVRLTPSSRSSFGSENSYQPDKLETLQFIELEFIELTCPARGVRPSLRFF